MTRARTEGGFFKTLQSLSQEGAKQRVIELLKQTSEYAASLLQRSDVRVDQGSNEHQARGCAHQQSAFEQRKRKRSSPRKKDMCLSAVSLALPRTPTQVRGTTMH